MLKCNMLTSRGTWTAFRVKNLMRYFSHKPRFSQRSLWPIRTPYRILLEVKSIENNELFQENSKLSLVTATSRPEYRCSLTHTSWHRGCNELSQNKQTHSTTITLPSLLSCETYRLTTSGNWMFRYYGNRQLR